jgi:hypothetical protein
MSTKMVQVPQAVSTAMADQTLFCHRTCHTAQSLAPTAWEDIGIGNITEDVAQDHFTDALVGLEVIVLGRIVQRSTHIGFVYDTNHGGGLSRFCSSVTLEQPL